MSLIVRPRLAPVLVALLCLPGVAGAAPAGSCDGDPTSGTLTADHTQGNPLSFTPDGEYTLTVDLPDGYRPAHRHTFVRLHFHGVSDGGERLLADTPSGDLLDPNTHWANGRVTGEDFNRAYLVPGNGPRIVTFEPLAGTTCVDIALVEVAEDSGDPNLPYAAQGIGPRFAKYTPREFPGLGLQFAEPTIGVNPNTGNLFAINTTDVLRISFDDSTNPAQDTWVATTPFVSTFASLDPILTSDEQTGRIFSLNLTGPISSADFSDDDGVTWLPGGNGFPTSGVDHQSLAAGPYPSTGLGALIPHPLYPSAVYYCSQGVADAYCSRSDDGGVTFRPPTVLYLNTMCTGLHGHVKVAPDGTVYVPNKACALDFPTFGAGVPGLIVSEDAGLTWTVRTVGIDETSASSHHGDPSVGIGRDGTVYYSYLSLDGHLKVGVSQDRGQTWSNIFDVGAIAGVHAAQFAAVVAGDPGRAAVAFIGTPFPDVPRIPIPTGPLQLVDAADSEIDFPGNFYGYIATTLDYGAHWFVTRVDPDDLLQGPAGIGGGGDNRNLLDFNDAVIDTEGRIVAAFADGCMGACQLGYQGNLYGSARIAQIVRQSGGPRMYAQFDPIEPAAPAAPRLTGYRTRDYVVVKIDADNGGSPITGFNISRDGALIAANYPQTTYVDATANDTGSAYHYTATAVNAMGEGATGNIFTPLVDQHAPVSPAVCTLPGQLWLDEVGEPGAITPQSDVANLGIAEPEDQPGKLVFTAVARAPGGSVTVAFDHPDGRRYHIAIRPTGTLVNRTDGRYFSDASSTLNNRLFLLSDVPGLDSSSAGPTGVYTAVLDKETWSLQTGDVLRNVTAFGLQATGTGQVFLRDFLGYDIAQPIVGNDFCAKGAHLPPPVVDLPTPPVPTVPPVAAPQSESRFGGGMPLLSVFMLALGGLLRRRRAARAHE